MRILHLAHDWMSFDGVANVFDCLVVAEDYVTLVRE